MNSFSDLKEKREKAREMTSRVRKLRAKAREEKAAREEANKKVKEFKKKRDEINQRIKKLKEDLMKIEREIEKIKPGEHTRDWLKRRIKRLEWDIQTKVLSPKKEEAMALEIEKLEKELDKWKSVDELISKKKEIQTEITSLKKESQAFHEALLHYAKESEFHHSQMMEIINKLVKLDSEFSEMKEKVKEAEEKAIKMRIEIEKKRKAEREKIKKENEEKERRLKNDLMEKAKKLWKDLQSGKKLSTDELKIIQTYLEEEK